MGGGAVGCHGDERRKGIVSKVGNPRGDDITRVFYAVLIVKRLARSNSHRSAVVDAAYESDALADGQRAGAVNIDTRVGSGIGILDSYVFKF